VTESAGRRSKSSSIRACLLMTDSKQKLVSGRMTSHKKHNNFFKLAKIRKGVCLGSYCNTMHNSKILETTQMFLNRKCPSNGKGLTWT
jgi:hypothetical protein